MVLSVCNDSTILNEFRMYNIVTRLVCIIIVLFLVVSIVRDYLNYKQNKQGKFLYIKFIIKIILINVILFLPNDASFFIKYIDPDSYELFLNCTKEVGTPGSEETSDGGETQQNTEVIIRDDVDLSKIRESFESLRKSLSLNDYKEVELMVHSISDSELRANFESELNIIKNYIVINSELDSLKVTFDDEKYVTVYNSVDAIKDDNDIKERLMEKVNSLGYAKPLNVQSGFKEESYNGIRYFIGIPKNALENMPLVVFLAGSGGYTKENGVNQLGINGEKYISEKFIYMAPNWVVDDTLKNVNTAINYIVSKYKVNKKKLIITGFSIGGTATWRMVSKYPNKYSAAVPISGSCPGLRAASYVNTPVLAISGGSESFTRTMNNCVKKINSAGGKARFTAYKGGHLDVANAFLKKEVIEWAFKQ